MSAGAPAAVPILTYHSLDESGSVISTPPAAFRAQMALLRERGFQGIALRELLDAWAGRGALPARPVVLTFDDAFRSVREHAAPALRAHGFRATVFAVAGYCGKTNDWPTQPKDVPRWPLLSHAELRELQADGCEIGAHGATHVPLDRVSAAAAEQELGGARRSLEDALGAPVRTLAYPYGIAPPAVREIARAHYEAGVSVEMGIARPSQDRLWLRRVEMYYLRDPRLFRSFGTPLGAAYLALRRLGRGLKALFG